MSKTTWGFFGAGAWGSAVALCMHQNGHAVKLWARNPAQHHHVQKKLAVTWPSDLPVLSDIKTVACADHWVIAVSSAGFIETLQNLSQCAPPKTLSWLTKGLMPASHGFFIDGWLRQQGYDKTPLALLSGPSFAKELAQHLPTSLVIASEDKALRALWQDSLSADYWHLFMSDDMRGVALMGALKNIIAIACGMLEGMGLQKNTQALLFTKAFSECQALCMLCAGQAATPLSVAGLGDLFLSASDNQSRNRRFGVLLGQGLSVIQAQDHIGSSVEGAQNSFLLLALLESIPTASCPILQATAQFIKCSISLEAWRRACGL